MHRIALIALLAMAAPAAAQNEVTDAEGDAVPARVDLVAVRMGLDQTFWVEVELAGEPGSEAWMLDLRFHRDGFYQYVDCSLPDRGCDISNVTTAGTSGSWPPGMMTVTGNVLRLENSPSFWMDGPFEVTRVEATTYAGASTTMAEFWLPEPSDTLDQPVQWRVGNVSEETDVANDSQDDIQTAPTDAPAKSTPGFGLAWLVALVAVRR